MVNSEGPSFRTPRVLVVCALAIVTPSSVLAQATPEVKLTVDRAIEMALTNRPLLRADEERVYAAKARVDQARSGLQPRVDLQASATDGPTGSPPLGLGGLVGTPLKKHTGGSLNLIQTLLDFGRTHNLVRARRQEVDAVAAARNADVNRVALEVRQAYLQLLQARRLREINRRIIEQRRLVARQAETLRLNGMGTRLDVDLAELNVSQAELALVRASNEEEVALAGLNAAMGTALPTNATLEDPVVQPDAASPALPELGQMLAFAAEQRPELQQLKSQIRAAGHQVSAAKSGRRPLLTGVASIGKNNPVTLFEPADKWWAVGLGLTVPLFTGGLVDAQVEEARRNGAALESSQRELLQRIRLEVTSTVANLRAANDAIGVARLQNVKAQDALSLATERFRAQLGSIVELSQAQVSYAIAQNDLIRAQYDRELAAAALDYATGRRFEKATRP